jgi:7-cyano-7-deazaguanine reductase
LAKKAKSRVGGQPFIITNMTTKPSHKLESFPNPAPQRDYLIHFEIPEFTCLCPLTGQPDFASFFIDIIGDKRNIELKSLKLYMWSFRDSGEFHEAVTNRIMDDIVKTIAPRYCRIVAKWYVRGGIYTDVIVEHRKKGWKPAPALDVVPAQPAGHYSPMSKGA